MFKVGDKVVVVCPVAGLPAYIVTGHVCTVDGTEMVSSSIGETQMITVANYALSWDSYRFMKYSEYKEKYENPGLKKRAKPIKIRMSPVIKITYACPKTGQLVDIEHKDFSSTGYLSGWGYDGDEDHYSDSGIDLVVDKCKACGEGHKETL